MKHRASSKISFKHELEDFVGFCLGETKSLLKFLVLLSVAYFANIAVSTVGASGYTYIAFQIIELSALVIASVEYLGSRAIEAWKALKNCIFKAKN
jgi:nitrate reductase NapE component